MHRLPFFAVAGTLIGGVLLSGIALDRLPSVRRSEPCAGCPDSRQAPIARRLGRDEQERPRAVRAPYAGPFAPVAKGIRAPVALPNVRVAAGPTRLKVEVPVQANLRQKSGP